MFENNIFNSLKNFFLKFLKNKEKFKIYETDILKIKIKIINGWVGGRLYVNNLSKGYHGLFKIWWDYFGLKGDVLLVGEEKPYDNNVKKYLKRLYPLIKNIYSVSLKNADIVWDITTEPKINLKFDNIICQAVLEHTIDPVSAIKNLSFTLKKNGFLFIHSHGPEFPYHPYPIDCYRFFRDGVVALAKLSKLTILDLFWTSKHWLAVFKKL